MVIGREDFGADERFAGSITSSRFVERYVNSALNKNRRRAAAIFRIFLCDSMSAAIPEQASDLSDILDRIYPDKKKTEDELRAELKNSDEALHGTQKDCMACHFKLDPAGRTMINISRKVSVHAAPGALSYIRKPNQLVNIPVTSVGHLAKVITEQPEFGSCQVQHFWRWFIGRDVQLTETRRSELAAHFENTGRKPWALVKLLVTSAEFKKTPQEQNPLKSIALQAKVLLQKCDSCHQARGGVNTGDGQAVPALTQWPIGGANDKMEFWLRNVVNRVLDLSGKIGNRTMPPRSSPWQPSVTDLKTLRDWIQVGAPDENGIKQITEGNL